MEHGNSQGAQDALREGMEQVAGFYHPAAHDKAAAAMVKGMDAVGRMDAAAIAEKEAEEAIAEKLPPQYNTRDADVALWFGVDGITWRARGQRGAAADLDTALADIRQVYCPPEPRGGDKAVQDRIITHERAAGRGEPRVSP